MYYRKADGTFVDVRSGGIIICYLGRGSSNGNTTATPFHQDFAWYQAAPVYEALTTLP